MTPPRRVRPCVALWGAFDVDDAAALGRGRLLEHELRRRSPGVDVRLLAPVGGARRPLALDGGRPAEALGALTAARCRRLAEEVDCLALVGAAPLLDDAYWRAAYGDDGGADCWTVVLAAPSLAPAVAWSGLRIPSGLGPDRRAALDDVLARCAVVALPEGVSSDGLHPGDDATVLPDPLLLASRVVGADVLRRRRGHLRLLGWLPEDDLPVTVLHGDLRGGGTAEEVAASLLTAREGDGDEVVVLVEGGRAHGADRVADALAAALGGRCRRLPAYADLTDIAAAVGAARSAVAGPGVVAALAEALDVPLRSPGAPAAAGRRGLVEAVSALDAHVATLAALAERAFRDRAARPAAAPRTEAAPDPLPVGEAWTALRLAHDVRGRRLVEERAAFVAGADRLRAEIATALAVHDQALGAERHVADGLRAEVAAARAEVVAVGAVLDARLAEHAAQERDLGAALAAAVEDVDRVTGLLADERAAAAEAAAAQAALRVRLEEAEAEVTRVTEQLRLVVGSRGWRALEQARQVRDRLRGGRAG